MEGEGRSGFVGGFVGFALGGAAFGAGHVDRSPEMEMARMRGVRQHRAWLTVADERAKTNFRP